MLPSLCLALAISLPATDHTPSSPMECYAPQVGDILLFHDPGPKNILFVLAGSPCISHSGIVVARPDGSLAIFEIPGIPYPVMLSDIPSRLRYYDGRVWVRRVRRPLTPQQAHSLSAYACSQEGKAYDIGGVLRPYFGRPTARDRKHCLTAADMNPRRWICSSLVVAAGVAAGLLDPCVVRLQTTDPQDLLNDNPLNLSPCWHSAERLLRCGTRTKSWWSQSCDGQIHCWN